MKRRLLSVGTRSIIFFVVFLLLFAYIQDVLRYKGERAEHMEARYESYFEQIDKGMDIDVLYIGSSPIYAAVKPMVMWDEYGFTGMNLAMSTQNAMSLYYGFLYALEVATPSVVVLDFCDIDEIKLASDDTQYYAFRKTTDVIKSLKLKIPYTIDIIRSSQKWDYPLPIVQFHDRWTELSKKDFDTTRTDYKEYTKGSYFKNDKVEVKLTGAYDTSVKPNTLCELPLSYYNKLIDLCKEKGIQIVCVSPPKANLKYNMPSYNAVAQFCADNDIPYFNYNSPELSKEISLNYKTDFYNDGHLNVLGSIKLSRSLASHLDEMYDLPDHRNDAIYASWNEELALFKEDYKVTLQTSME